MSKINSEIFPLSTTSASQRSETSNHKEQDIWFNALDRVEMDKARSDVSNESYSEQVLGAIHRRLSPLYPAIYQNNGGLSAGQHAVSLSFKHAPWAPI